jgi:hypothetical protein
MAVAFALGSGKPRRAQSFFESLCSLAIWTLLFFSFLFPLARYPRRFGAPMDAHERTPPFVRIADCGLQINSPGSGDAINRASSAIYTPYSYVDLMSNESCVKRRRTRTIP